MLCVFRRDVRMQSSRSVRARSAELWPYSFCHVATASTRASAMLRGVGDFVVILLFIINSLQCFHSGWPLMVYRSARKKAPSKGVRHIRDVPLYRCVLLSKRFGSSNEEWFPAGKCANGTSKTSKISHVVLEKEGQLIEFVWIPIDLGGRVSAEVTHAANKFGFYLGRLHSDSFHL